uniref:primase-helicase zinc-binding domain-containing protein n=1 Tax=Cupriavidus taiwanensis TaxID=164546 RepID=UPI001EF149C9|nr:primase-helicase zinc-binding domain-containing protein [Cupriavidus taiwanensis]
MGRSAQALSASGSPDGQLLAGPPGPCPLCGGHDRFTYDNKRGRGDWVCRKCNAGSPKAGDGLELVRCFTGLSYRQLLLELNGGPALPIEASAMRGPAPRHKINDSAAKLRRIARKWNAATELSPGDHAMRYLAARVPGLRAPKPSALRLAMQADGIGGGSESKPGQDQCDDSEPNAILLASSTVVWLSDAAA